MAKGAEFFYLFCHLIYYGSKTVTFGCGDPVQPQSFLLYAELSQHFLEQWYPASFFYITFQVMTFAGMSAADKNTVGA